MYGTWSVSPQPAKINPVNRGGCMRRDDSVYLQNSVMFVPFAVSTPRQLLVQFVRHKGAIEAQEVLVGKISECMG